MATTAREQSCRHDARWRRDGREIYYAARDASGEWAILAVPVTTSGASIAFGQPQTLFTLRLQERNWAFDVTRDGQRFVAIVEGEDQVTVTVLLGATPRR